MYIDLMFGPPVLFLPTTHGGENQQTVFDLISEHPIISGGRPPFFAGGDYGVAYGYARLLYSPGVRPARLLYSPRVWLAHLGGVSEGRYRCTHPVYGWCVCSARSSSQPVFTHSRWSPIWGGSLKAGAAVLTRCTAGASAPPGRRASLSSVPAGSAAPYCRSRTRCTRASARSARSSPSAAAARRRRTPSSGRAYARRAQVAGDAPSSAGRSASPSATKRAVSSRATSSGQRQLTVAI